MLSLFCTAHFFSAYFSTFPKLNILSLTFIASVRKMQLKERRNRKWRQKCIIFKVFSAVRKRKAASNSHIGTFIAKYGPHFVTLPANNINVDFDRKISNLSIKRKLTFVDIFWEWTDLDISPNDLNFRLTFLFTPFSSKF